RQRAGPAVRHKTEPPETDRDSAATPAAASAQEEPGCGDVHISHLLSLAPRSPWLPVYNSCSPSLLPLRPGHQCRQHSNTHAPTEKTHPHWGWWFFSFHGIFSSLLAIHYLRSELGCAGHGQNIVLFAQFAVLSQAASGLAHKPDRCGVRLSVIAGVH